MVAQSPLTRTRNLAILIALRATKEVILNGEAYFEITKNPQKPFIVKTNNLEIKVLGTKFNVDDFGVIPN